MTISHIALEDVSIFRISKLNQDEDDAKALKTTWIQSLLNNAHVYLVS